MHKSLVLAAFLLAAASPLGAEHLDFSFDFPTPSLSARGSVQEVAMGDLPCSVEPGRPALPFRPVRLLLPFDKELVRSEIRVERWERLDGKIRLATVAPIGPISLQRPERRRFLKLYPRAPKAGTAPYRRGPSHVDRGVQGLRGHRFVDLNLRPVRADATTESVEWAPRMTVRLHLADAQQKLETELDALKDDEATRIRVARLVENPDVLASYADRAPRLDEGERVDYLVVTTAFLAAAPGPDNLQAFCAFLEEQGLKTKIVLDEELAAGEKGEDRAAKIRAGIARHHREHGVSWVLLAGDAHADTIPARRLHADFVWEGRTFSEELAADIYYACLDGDFDGDGDGVYGEPGDGPDGGEVDLYAELAVGRAPVDTHEELASFVRKTKQAYAMAEDGANRKILFAGENLFPGVWGSQYMGELETGASAHGFATTGVSPGWTVDHLYDKTEAGVRKWNASDLVAKFNGRPYQVHHVGHCATWMMMRMYSSSIASIDAAEPFLVYTQGCHCGRFTNDDCIAERLFNAPRGPFAVFANSHYGLGPEDPDDDATVVCRGASQYFHRQFVDAYFGEGIRRLGLLNQDSKEDNVPWMHHGTTRWVYWEMNLFGDPHLPLVR